ncbi:hypothetical protein [Actinomadura rubrisoli]|uniref:Phospholipid carrier-dependent glycosyltransferase n=1 Tax=Actinomadura rubrisoli TaxID=2530368 RepID=A0A4R5BA28_9ACTN|nr:hypothetical protein [Actinomadura rubrisoli]TDD81520.1 hypothetical protein E1298_24015 [Actinomadura rubrisoli]
MSAIHAPPLPAEREGVAGALRGARTRDLLRPDALFVVLLTVGTALRALAVAGYRPALWFNDSYDYVRIGVAPFPHPLRAPGYGLMLWLLKPLHSLATVAALQHVMILILAIAAYRAMVGTLGVGRRTAALATAPVLLDAYQIQLEHILMSDTLFTALVFGAMVTLVRKDSRWSWLHAATAGGVLGAAAVTRTVGMALVFVAVLYLVARYRTRWRRSVLTVAALLAAFALPVGASMVWFHSEHGRYALTDSDGVFLWGRTAAFADCTAHTPPERLARMCPRKPPGERSASSTQIWEEGSPTGWQHGHAFSPETNELAKSFALWAMRTQPTDYAETVSYDFFVRTFAWSRVGYPHPWTESFYHFTARPRPVPGIALIGGGMDAEVAREYERGPAETRVVEPYAAPLRGYQRFVRLPGTVLALIVLAGAAGMLRRRRNSAWLQAGLLWATGITLLAVPPLAVDFDYRYTLPATPFLCIAAVTAWRRPAVNETPAAEREETESV